MLTRFVDDDNNCYAFLNVTGDDTSTLEIWENTGGNHTQLDPTVSLSAPFNTRYNLTLTDNGSSLTATVESGGVSKSLNISTTAHASGTGVGFGHWLWTGSLMESSRFQKFET